MNSWSTAEQGGVCLPLVFLDSSNLGVPILLFSFLLVCFLFGGGGGSLEKSSF